MDRSEVSVCTADNSFCYVKMVVLQISKVEVDYPDETKTKLSEFSDYPPRIAIDLTPSKQASAEAVLNVMGLKGNCCFRIANGMN